MGHVSGAGIGAPENEMQNSEISSFLDIVTLLCQSLPESFLMAEHHQF
jgi:hypothetical protein